MPVQSSPVQSSPVHLCPKSRRKVLLVTLHGNCNYGNTLQRLALAQVIDGLGFEVWHLLKGFPELKLKRWAKKLLSLIRRKKISHHKPLQGQTIYHEFADRFSKFQAKYITNIIRLANDKPVSAYEAVLQEYDYAVVGSDQVWHNCSRTHKELEYYYLSFMPRGKRISYAPSFSFKVFPIWDYWAHKKGLLGFERISCREQEMIPMIKSISGKDAQLVLDPTMLLGIEQWREFAVKPEYDVPDKYVLCYFLGSKPAGYLDAISRAAGNMPVISLLDDRDQSHYLTDPGNFLYLMDHADFVCTDSFHGTVFSLLFRKNFLVFRRQEALKGGMFGRIEGLLDSLDITGRVYESGMKIRPEPVNYDEAYTKLETLRESSMNYLRECLK